MAKENRILFVEGADDQHTIWAICEHFKVAETFVVEVPDGAGKINPKLRAGEKGGIDNVLKAMQGFLAAQNVERLGVVIDADADLLKQWKRISAILQKIGYEETALNPNGTIIEQENKIKFGVWIMPDNKIERGFLETFLTLLVPESNKSWEQAKNCVANLEEKPFIKTNIDHTTKAEIHTFLAWQEEPGKPFGQAITAKYLQADNPNCENFVNWLKRLFVE
ncbi:MAG TPA: hypothetical protein PKE69_01585 [Pyrinomonadaceae bacterium]|nr:hypothetical protein [Pyrinomonadaceae bacterium]